MFRRLRRREAARLVAWASERSIPLDLRDTRESARRLAGLDPLLAGKRIAFLGEANHWVHEKYAVRESVLYWLRARGFNLVGEELSSSDGRRVQRYLETDDGDELSRVTAFGYTGCRRTDRDDAPRGALRDDDPRSSVVRTALPLALGGGLLVHTAPATQADVLVFRREVSPLRS